MASNHPAYYEKNITISDCLVHERGFLSSSLWFQYIRKL